MTEPCGGTVALISSRDVVTALVTRFLSFSDEPLLRPTSEAVVAIVFCVVLAL